MKRTLLYLGTMIFIFVFGLIVLADEPPPEPFVGPTPDHTSKDKRYVIEFGQTIYMAAWDMSLVTCKTLDSIPDEIGHPHCNGALCIKKVHESECCEVIFKIVAHMHDTFDVSLDIMPGGGTAGPPAPFAQFEVDAFDTGGVWYLVVVPPCDGEMLIQIKHDGNVVYARARCSREGC